MRMRSRFLPAPCLKIPETTIPAMRVDYQSGGRRSPGSGCAQCVIQDRVLNPIPDDLNCGSHKGVVSWPSNTPFSDPGDTGSSNSPEDRRPKPAAPSEWGGALAAPSSSPARQSQSSALDGAPVDSGIRLRGPGSMRRRWRGARSQRASRRL